jgi:hypothetical protein
MAHIVSVLGSTLRDMLLRDGWTLEWERKGRCQVSKGGKQRGFPLNVGIPVKLVKSYAQDAGWDAAKFEDLLHAKARKR